MPISEARRSDLYTGLIEVFGSSRAETLMNALRISDLDEVATKRDVADLCVEIAGLRAEMKSDFTRLSFILVAGCLAIVATLIGVGLTS